jgi:hypothetical protein
MTKQHNQMSYKLEPSEPKDQNTRVLEVIDEIRELFLTKNDAYVISPVEILPMESWLHQIRIKAERALQAKDPRKRNEEIKDCAVYCLLALGKDRLYKKI